VCQKVTPFWYPSFLPLLDALHLQFLITYISFLPRDARSASAVLLLYVVRPSVCLSLTLLYLYRVANFQKMKFGTWRRDRDAVGVEGVGMGRGYLSCRLEGLGSVVTRELPQRGPGRGPGQKRIWCILSVAECLWLKENQVFRETFITAYTSLYRGHKGWTSLKLITRIISVGSSLLGSTASAI